MKFEYQATEDFGKPLKQRLGMYPRKADITWDALRWLSSWIGVLIVRSQFKLVVNGAIPQGERFAIVANHQSHLDTVTLLAALPSRLRQKVCVLAAEDYFFNRTDKAIAASLLSQAVAYDRLHWTSVRAWMRYLKHTQTGWLLFYPSGSRKSDTLHSGLLKMLIKQNWRILPARLEGTDRAWPVGAFCWRPFTTLKVTFHAPYEGNDLEELMTKLEKELKS
jgi:1-acyl-sn-glycerol-3-phosphate acyltransferase